MRAGWFTGGVMFQIAEPTCRRFVRRGDARQHDLRRRDVRVLLEEVVLDRPDVLEVPGVARHGQVGLAHEPVVLGARRVRLHLGLRDVRLDEEAEFHRVSLTSRRCVGTSGAGVLNRTGSSRQSTRYVDASFAGVLTASGMSAI